SVARWERACDYNRRPNQTLMRRGSLNSRWLAATGCLIGALAMGVAACGGDDDSGGGDTGGGGGGGKTLTVYSSLPLQGASRPQTTAVVDGVKLALDQAG